MLAYTNLTAIAKRYQTSLLNIQREYFQHLFLSQFYLQKESKDIYFKGGTALRFVYRSPRFSEDLDFSTPLINLGKIETGIINCLDEIKRQNLDIEISESKRTIGGYLAKIILRLGGQPVQIKVEISSRDKSAHGETVAVSSDFINSYIIIALDQKLIVKEKVQALLTRGKPRDFYDLYFLIRAGLLSKDEKALFTQMLEKVRKTEISFKKELEKFLPESHWLLIKELKEALEREISRFIA